MKRSPNKPRTGTAIRSIPIILGMLGIPLGITLGALEGRFLPVHFGLMGLSIVSIAGGLLWLREARWKETISAVVYSAFVILCLALVYLLSANRPVRFDLTRAQVHTLSPQTQSILRAIPVDRRVMAYVFAPQAEHAAMGRFLETYENRSPQFRFVLFDAARDLDVAAQFGNVEQHSLHLVLLDEEGQQIKRGAPEGLRAGSQMREHALTNAIARLLRGEDEKLYYSFGHGEKSVDRTEGSYSKILELVTQTALPVEPIRLTEGRIPPDAAGIIVAGPTIDFFDYEVELLIEYLDEGGKLFLLLDPIYGQTRQLENVERILAHVGLTAPNRFIVDPQAITVHGSSFTPMVSFARHPIAMATQRTPFYMDRARPIESLDELPRGVQLDAVLFSSDQTWTEPAHQPRSVRSPRPPSDPQEIGVQLAAVAAMKSTPGGRRGDEMRMVVTGDSDAFIDAYHGQNGDAAMFFVQTINWLREREELLHIPPRYVESTPIVLTTTRVWTILGIFLFAGIAITFGGTTWAMIRRRQR